MKILTEQANYSKFTLCINFQGALQESSSISGGSEQLAASDYKFKNFPLEGWHRNQRLSLGNDTRNGWGKTLLFSNFVPIFFFALK